MQSIEKFLLITIEYPKPSYRDKILVEEYMKPTFIYEEAQGDAFIRAIDEYERSKKKRKKNTKK